MPSRYLSLSGKGQLYIETKKKLKNTIQRKFDMIKSEMIDEFNSHPVTVELDNGENSENISGTLSRGNLFSFIGFSQGSKPTEIIRQYLMKSTFKFSRSNMSDFKISFSIPSKEELFDATPLPWATGRSWLKGIEHGMSGLGRYIYGEFDNSRSGAGIQSNYKVFSGKFKNIPYISRILNDAKEKLNKINQGI